MTVERSWRIPNVDEDDAKPEGAMWYEGWLVPDGRLEAIADAWKAYLDPQRDGQWSDVQGLLDALTEEKS